MKRERKLAAITFIMEMRLINKALLLVISFNITATSFAQIPEDYKYHDFKKQFPKESFVYLSLNYVDVFDIKKDELEITLGYREKLLYLNNNAYQL